LFSCRKKTEEEGKEAEEEERIRVRDKGGAK